MMRTSAISAIRHSTGPLPEVTSRSIALMATSPAVRSFTAIGACRLAARSIGAAVDGLLVSHQRFHCRQRQDKTGIGEIPHHLTRILVGSGCLLDDQVAVTADKLPAPRISEQGFA